MKKYNITNSFTFLIGILFTTICFSQEIYKNNKTDERALFLGSIEESGCFQVYQNGLVQFENNENLNQIDQLNLMQLLKEIGKLDLVFNFEGNEPFWNVQINETTLTFNDNEKRNFKIDFVQDQQSDFVMMFSSKKNEVFGLMKRINIKKNKKEGCQLSLTDNHSVYELYVSIRGVMYKACGSITHASS